MKIDPTWMRSCAVLRKSSLATRGAPSASCPRNRLESAQLEPFERELVEDALTSL